MRSKAKALALAGLVAPGFLATWVAPAVPEGGTEHLRPRLHFTPAKNFMNDPNGLVYLDGEYHLFYQHNPEGDRWGHMSWGHAVSRDLLSWEHLPLALREEGGVMVFSGSAVVDADDTSGLCGGAPARSCLVAIWTGHGHGRQTQNLAVSLDRGRTWRKHAGNPVIDLHRDDNRDPKVFWHEPTRRWIMVTVLAGEKKVRFFSSTDLRRWETLSDFGPAGATGGAWECPDLFPLSVDGEPDKVKWVLDVDLNPGGPVGGSGAQYFVGTFDGRTFVNENPPGRTLWVDYGRDFYASQSYSNLPASPPRVLWVGWMSNWDYANDEPTSPWRGVQSLPRELGLRRTPDGLRLVQAPLRELASRRSSAEPRAVETPADLPGSADIEVEVVPGDWTRPDSVSPTRRARRRSWASGPGPSRCSSTAGSPGQRRSTRGTRSVTRGRHDGGTVASPCASSSTARPSRCSRTTGRPCSRSASTRRAPSTASSPSTGGAASPRLCACGSSRQGPPGNERCP